MRLQDLTGKRFGRLTAILYNERIRRWHCRCDCGVTKSVLSGHLTKGLIRSCGCYRRDVTTRRNITHGLSDTPTWNAWMGMRQRCYNPRNKRWKRYGGRGIQVCARWFKFENFLADMGECPNGLTIDRINNDLSYMPSNCRWTTVKEQCQNTCRNLKIPEDVQESIRKQYKKWRVGSPSLSKKYGVSKYAVYKVVKPLRKLRHLANIKKLA